MCFCCFFFLFLVTCDHKNTGTIIYSVFIAHSLVSIFQSSPFDVEDFTLSSGNVSKATVLQRRVSVYSQGTPETPTFQDASFFVSPIRSPQASGDDISRGILDFVVDAAT